VSNNPINYTDPSGHCVEDFCVGETALAVGLIGGAIVGGIYSGISQYQSTGKIDINKLVYDSYTGAIIGGGIVLAGAVVAVGFSIVGAVLLPSACADGDCTNEVNKVVTAGIDELEASQNSIEEVKPGSFSIINWAGYPEGNVPKPTGPFQLINGEDYQIVRNAANQTNRAIHEANPSLSGLVIHEIQPVKFGGSPIDLSNKVFLSPEAHAQYTTWWNNLQRLLKIQ
jgi:hypothetical protein